MLGDWGVSEADLQFTGLGISQSRRNTILARQNTIHSGLMVTIEWMALERLQYIKNMLKSFYYIARSNVLVRRIFNMPVPYLPDVSAFIGHNRQSIRENYRREGDRPFRQYLP